MPHNINVVTAHGCDMESGLLLSSEYCSKTSKVIENPDTIASPIETPAVIKAMLAAFLSKLYLSRLYWYNCL